MVQVAESDPVAIRREQIRDAELWPRSRRRVLVTDPSARPVKPADAAQARNFKAILQAEFTRLNELANRRGGALELLRDADFGESQASREFLELNGCIDEVRDLLEALRDRFGIAE